MWQIISFSLLGSLLLVVLARNFIVKYKIKKFYSDKSRKGIYKKIIKQEINKYFEIGKNSDYLKDLTFEIKTNLFATEVYIISNFVLTFDKYKKNTICQICFKNKTNQPKKLNEMEETLQSVNLVFN